MPEPMGAPTDILLLGDPVAHSLSAVFQNAAFAATGLPLRYTPRRVPAEHLVQTIAAIRADPTVVGANVTIPHKLTVVRQLDHLSGMAAALESVNTVARDGARLIGYNTDADGFARSLDEAAIPVAARVLLLGTGGAARAVAAVLGTRAAEVIVAGRSADGAEAIARLVGPAQGRPIPFDRADAVLTAEAIDLVVNATSIGMDGRSAPLDPRHLHEGQAVVDLVYRPVWTPLLEGARAAGARPVNGLGMLLFQGAAAFEIWTGTPAPLKVMRPALEMAAGARI